MEDKDILFKHKVLAVINSEENLKATSQAIETSNKKRDENLKDLKHDLELKYQAHSSDVTSLTILVKNNYTSLSNTIVEKEKSLIRIFLVIQALVMAAIALMVYFK